uniref:Odorant receptor n=1 Tax=Phlebotomus papatasi TaxID=29031 RepID=A0A3F2ZEP8_PHLPP
MVDYIECYTEYLEFEKTIRFLIKILNLSILRLKFLHGYEKYILPVLQTYSLISTVFTFVYYDRDVMLFGLNTMTIVAILQLLSKTFSTVINSNELNELFLFIQEVHQAHEIDFITNSVRIHFTWILRITKIVLRFFLIPVWCITAAAFTVYCAYCDILLLGIPGIFPKSMEISYMSLFQHVHQFFLLSQIAFSVVIGDVILLTFGLYFVAITNVFSHTIRSLENSELSHITKALLHIQKFHCKLLKNYQLLNEVFGYVFTIQTATSVVFILFIFYFIQNEETLVFFPLFLTVITQFGVFCVFGEFLYSKTEEIDIELYQSKWYEFDIKDQKMLLLMMCMAKRPFGIRAAGMYDINLIMFIQVIKAGISFCAILYTFA